MVKRTMGTNDGDPKKMVDTLEQRGDDEVVPNPKRRAEERPGAAKAEHYLEMGVGGGQWKGIAIFLWAQVRQVREAEVGGVTE